MLALILFIATNAALPMLLSTQYRIQYDSRSPAPLAQFDPLTVDEILDAADRLGGRSVFWIGDSIVWSGSEYGITGPQLLETELRARYGNDIHVLNAALPAARTADKYAVLLRVLERRPALVIYETKYLEYSRAQVETITFRYPYLNDVVAADPEYAAHYRDFPETRPPLRAPISREEIVVQNTMQRWSSIVRYRALLQQILFGGDLYGRLSGQPPQPGPPTFNAGGGPGQPGARIPNPAARLPQNFTGAYRSGPFDAFPNAGLFFARRVAAALDATDVPVVAYVAALNHTLLGPLADDALFHSNLAMLKAVFQGHRFPFTDYQDALPEDRFFLDTEHLSAAGHLLMVRGLIEDHQAVFDGALGARR